jgi:hypothetical protein
MKAIFSFVLLGHIFALDTANLIEANYKIAVYKLYIQAAEFLIIYLRRLVFLA